MDIADDDNVYETDASLHQYLGLHFPSFKSISDANLSPILEHANAPLHGLRFPQRIAQWLIELSGVKDEPENASPQFRALDVGCAVGGSSFELAKHFSKVDAFDFSATFIQAAEQMKQLEHVTFMVPVEGDISETMVAKHEEGVTKDVASRVNFFVGDACQMGEMLQTDHPSLFPNGYDAILLANLLCRVPDPMACLEALPLLIKPKGVVLILTPFTWLEEFTLRDQWLGGYYKSANDDIQNDNSEGKPSEKKRRGEPCRGIDRLEEEMSRLGFVKIGSQEMPLVIREHVRKYQYIISHATGWKKA